MNPPRPHASWNRRRRTAPPPTLRRRKPNGSWSNISTATRLATGESGHGRQARRPGNPGNPRQAGRTIFRGRANPRMCRHGHGNGQRHHIQAASHRKEAHGKSLAAEEGGGRGVLLTAGPYRRTGRTIVFLLRRQGAGRIFSRPAARLHRQARREGHRRRHGQGERLHRREDQGRRGKESAGGGRSGCGGAGAEHAGTATVLVHALRLRFGPGFRPVRRRIPFLRRFRRLDRWFRVSGLVGCPRTRTPRNCPAPTRAYERTNTMPQLTTLIPSFAAPVTDRVWLVGAHGGAGCTTIRHSDPERFADAGRALPVSQDPSMPSRIILCAMARGAASNRCAHCSPTSRPDCSAHRSCWARPSPTPRPVCPGLWWRRASNCHPPSACGGCPISKGLNSTGFPGVIRPRTHGS